MNISLWSVIVFKTPRASKSDLTETTASVDEWPETRCEAARTTEVESSRVIASGAVIRTLSPASQILAVARVLLAVMPRRARRARRVSLARANRLRTVPTGQLNREAASS